MACMRTEKPRTKAGASLVVVVKQSGGVVRRASAALSPSSRLELRAPFRKEGGARSL
jgi:hypothetical protein